MTLLLKLRERAKGSKHLDWAKAARVCADILEAGLSALHREPSDVNMVLVNGHWALAHRILKEYPPEPVPVPPRTDVVRLAA